MSAILLCLCLAQTARAQFNEYAVPDKYLQYVPGAAALFLPFTGVEAGHSWFWDRAIVAGVGFLAESAIVNSIKYTVRETRPDGSADNSFPSGHTATAFLGAEMVRCELGWGWGAGAYAVATSVAVLRVYHQRHWWWDVAAGAGAGVLSAHIGYWLLQPVKDLFGIRMPERVRVAAVPAIDPYSGTFCASLAMTF